MEGVKNTFIEYCDITTIHGFVYLFKNGLSVFERLLWIIIISVGMIYTVKFSNNIINDWNENHVLTTVATTGKPVNEIEFPAITICAEVKFLTASMQCDAVLRIT